MSKKLDYIDEYLVNKINKNRNDISESSFWKQMYKNFDINDINEKFINSTGIGGANKATFLKKIYHYLTIYPFLILNKKLINKNGNYKYAKKYCEKTDKIFDVNVLRQVMSLSFIQEKLSNSQSLKDICVIGDGLASMTLILYQLKDSRNIYLVNLTKSLLLDYIFIKKYFRNTLSKIKVRIIKNTNDLEKINFKEKNILLIEASNQNFLREISIDLAINIASMQEMNNHEIKNYFFNLRNNKKKNTFFYCCNRTEKKLPDGNFTRFKEYPWNKSDKIYAHEICPWYKFYLSKKFPFFHKYHGDIEHKLIKF